MIVAGQKRQQRKLLPRSDEYLQKNNEKNKKNLM